MCNIFKTKNARKNAVRMGFGKVIRSAMILLLFYFDRGNVGFIQFTSHLFTEQRIHFTHVITEDSENRILSNISYFSKLFFVQ